PGNDPLPGEGPVPLPPTRTASGATTGGERGKGGDRRQACRVPDPVATRQSYRAAGQGRAREHSPRPAEAAVAVISGFSVIPLRSAPVGRANLAFSPKSGTLSLDTEFMPRDHHAPTIRLGTRFGHGQRRREGSKKAAQGTRGHLRRQ